MPSDRNTGVAANEHSEQHSEDSLNDVPIATPVLSPQGQAGKANLRPWPKNRPGRPNSRNRARPATFQKEREDRVGVMDMARILGIVGGKMSVLGSEGLLPSTCHKGVRYFNVDEVLEKAPRLGLGFPPLKVKQKTYMEDSSWAWDALSMGPANCKRAPSARAWRLYLDAKTDSVVRRKLIQMHMMLTSRQFDHCAGFGLESEPGSKLEASETQADSFGGSPRKLSPAEQCLEGLAKGYLDGPLSVPPETPMPPEPPEPAGQLDETGY